MGLFGAVHISAAFGLHMSLNGESFNPSDHAD